MSAFGTTRTFRNVCYSVAVGGKADIEQAASTDLNSVRYEARIKSKHWVLLGGSHFWRSYRVNSAVSLQTQARPPVRFGTRGLTH
jgi:hypothetical protein